MPFQGELVTDGSRKSYPRMVIKMEPKQLDVDTIAKKFLKKTVYVDWPHCTEAMVVQVFDAKKKYNASGEETQITENPCDFNTCVEGLKAKYESILMGNI